MNRREIIAGLGSTAAWPVMARAQQPGRMRHIGVLMVTDENDPEGKAELSEFTKGLVELGWIDAHTARREAGRSPGAASDKIRDGR
jgi:putative ABC transport system substrate-binding protein